MSLQEDPASPPARLMTQRGFNLGILVIIGFATPIDVGSFKKRVEQTWIKHPRCSSVLVDKKHRRSAWKRVKVDIEKHFVVPDLDPNMENADEFMEDYASGLSKYPLDKTKPLWEFHILNMKTSKANSTAILKIHHSVGDGVSLVSLLLACSKKASDPESLPVFPTKRSKPSIPDVGLMKRFFSWVRTTFLIIFYTLIDMTMAAATTLFLDDAENPIKLQRGVGTSSGRIFTHRIVSLGDVKLIKNAMNATINDVLVGMSEAGLSRYINTRYGENCAGVTSKKTSHIPRNLRIRSTIAFNLRPSAAITDLAEVMEMGKKTNGELWGNRVGFAILPLTIGMEDNPLTHVHRIKAAMDRKKLSREAQIHYFLAGLGTKVIGPKLTAFLTKRFLQHVSLTFSNIVGPQEEIILFDHPVSYMAPSVFVFPQSMIIHFMTYADKIVISVGADGYTIPNPHQLCDEIVKSLEHIKETLVKQGLV